MLKDAFVITKTFAANAECVDSPLFICPEGAEYEVVEVMERHETLGTNGGAVTIDVVKAASGAAVAGATSVLDAPFNAKAVIATTVRKTRALATLATRAICTLTAGQALGVDFVGVLTALDGVCITVVLRMHRPALNR